MAAPKKLARQSRFREHSSQDQPTLSQLLSAAADAPSSSAPSVTAILNHWKRTTLCRQIEALRSQTAPLAHIWICLFASPIAESARLAALAYNDSRIAVFEADANLKYYGRFQIALSAPTKYVWLIDDDMVPGPRYLSVVLHAASTRLASRALLGSIGWLLPQPLSPDGKLSSYRSLDNRTGGLYVPDMAYDIMIERMMEVDYLCSMWFGETSWMHLLFREAPLTFETGEDFHLSHMLRKHAGIRSLVLPVQFDDRSTWGDTDHSLAYARYTTGGKAKIELRDRIWWSGLQGGGTLHWATPSLRTRAASRALSVPAALVLVDGAEEARVLRPLLAEWLRPSPSSPRRSPRSLASSPSPSPPSPHLRLGIVLTGGVRGGCASVLPLLGVDAAACSQRRLRVFNMRLGADLPALRRRTEGAEYVPEASTPTATSSLTPASTSTTGQGMWPIRPSRMHDEALTDLQPIVKTMRPVVMISLAAASPSTWAAAVLSSLNPPTHFPLSTRATPLQLRLLSSFSFAALSRWRAVHLHTVVILPPRASPQQMGHLQRSIEASLLSPAGSSLALHLQFGSSADVVRAAHSWRWEHGSKVVRFRITRAGSGMGPACAHMLPAIEGAVERAESWHPARANSSESESMLLLEDGMELSEGAWIYLKHALMHMPRAHLLGIALGPPTSRGLSGRYSRELGSPSSCGTAFLSNSWQALQTYVTEHLESARAACGVTATENTGVTALGWDELLTRFMEENGYKLFFPGVSLCRRQGDNSTRLASEHELAELLRAS